MLFHVVVVEEWKQGGFNRPFMVVDYVHWIIGTAIPWNTMDRVELAIDHDSIEPYVFPDEVMDIVVITEK